MNNQVTPIESYNDHSTLPTSNVWTCQQYNANNAYNVTIPTANVNNNNKTNSYAVVPVAESERLRDLLFWAEGDCWRNKKQRIDAARHHYNLAKVFDLLDSLISGKYKPSTSVCFVLNYPRYREVFAASYIDRIIHHLVAPFILSITESVHTSNGDISHGNRPCKSALTAALQIQSYMNMQPEGYVATMDVSGFFMNIDRVKAYNIFVWFYERYRTYTLDNWYCDTMLWLLRILLLHDPTSDCIRNSPDNMWKHIAANKTLFGNKGKGLPIGNFYSQLIANLILAIWAMEILQISGDFHISQFVDDMCVVAKDAETIRKVRERSFDVLKSIGLTLHKDKYYIQPVRHGVYFCGRVIYRNRIYTSGRTIRACKNSINNAILNCSLPNAYKLQSSYNSYMGFMCKCHNYKMQRELAFCILNSDYNKWLYFEEYKNKLICRVFDEHKPKTIHKTSLIEILKQQNIFEHEYCKTKRSP